MAGPATMCSFSIETLNGVMTGLSSVIMMKLRSHQRQQCPPQHTIISNVGAWTYIVPLMKDSFGWTVEPELFPVTVRSEYVVLSCEIQATYCRAESEPSAYCSCTRIKSDVLCPRRRT